jgi:putative hemolysin
MLIESHDRLVRRPENPQRQHLAGASSSQFTISITREPNEIREAQRLRYQVFGVEGGARLPSASLGLDIDRYDRHCDHLIARDVATSEVVGTYRILPPRVAMHMGFYSDTEFVTSELNQLKPAMCEFGRACVDHRYRSGAVIMQLWAGLAAYMLQHGYEHVLGVASVALNDGGHNAASMHHAFSKDGSLSPRYRVTPRKRLDLAPLDLHRDFELPALVRGYLRVGAKVCGAPAFDKVFNCADFLMLLSLDNMHPRYARHFGVPQALHSTAAGG